MTTEERLALDFSENHSEFIAENQKTECWGCGLLLLLPSPSPVFKCGWCGAVTDSSRTTRRRSRFRWRRFRDQCFVSILLVFMLFVICGGVWAIYPILFFRSLFVGCFNCIIASVLSVITLSTFGLTAFRHAGVPPSVSWGRYPDVPEGALEGFTFCHECLKPKSPTTHHCHSCGSCILDMDHHCPFIGNCVGAGNHRHFIFFLLSASTSAAYVSFMSAYTVTLVRPSLYYYHNPSIPFAPSAAMALPAPAFFFSPRGLILVYLFFAAVSADFGLVVLLWQQLCFIYYGKTYLSLLNRREGDDGGEGRDSGNLFRFFGLPHSGYSLHFHGVPPPRKRHEV